MLIVNVSEAEVLSLSKALLMRVSPIQPSGVANMYIPVVMSVTIVHFIDG